MNKTLTSKEAIIAASKEIASQSGISDLNMREIAAKCGVAVGSVYNYFPSKSDLVAATVESIWREIVMGSDISNGSSDFLSSVKYLFEFAKKGTDNYPNFFSVHTTGFGSENKSRGREIMTKFFGELNRNLICILENDNRVSNNAFNDKFDRHVFVDFVLSNVLMLLQNNNANCDTLLEVICRTIY